MTLLDYQKSKEEGIRTDSQMNVRSDFTVFHERSIRNKEAIKEASVVGCCYCLTQFQPVDIVDFHVERRGDMGETGLCPVCGIDSLIPFKQDEDAASLLPEINRDYFTVMKYAEEYETWMRDKVT